MRIAKGAGVTVPEVNNLVDRFHEAQKMMKQMQGMPGMAGVPGGVVEHVHHDAEQLHVRPRPPRHMAGGFAGECCDRRV